MYWFINVCSTGWVKAWWQILTGENEKILPSETPVHIPAIERHPTYKLQEQFPTSQKCLNPVCNASLPTTPAAHRVRECHPKVAGVRSAPGAHRVRGADREGAISINHQELSPINHRASFNSFWTPGTYWGDYCLLLFSFHKRCRNPNQQTRTLKMFPPILSRKTLLTSSCILIKPL